jgi:hypothetical protein
MAFIKNNIFKKDIRLSSKSIYINNFSNQETLESIQSEYKCKIISLESDEELFTKSHSRFSNYPDVKIINYNENTLNFKDLNVLIFENDIKDIDILNLKLGESAYRILNILCDTEYISIIQNIVIHKGKNISLQSFLNDPICSKLKKSHKMKKLYMLNSQHWEKI